MSRTLWINAGELSGDMHGALLLKALREKDPSLSFTGMGGPYLREAGLDARFSTDQLSVMGFTEVLGHLPRIFKLIADIKTAMAKVRPEAVIVIDAPDFHFRVIKAAKALGIPVYYYISPKVWAWRENRAKFIQANVRRLISILPFEAAFYKRFNMDIDYVGNPLVDIVDYPSLKDLTPVPGQIGLLPGSRKREVTSLLPEFGKAARILRERLPHLTFTCVRAPGLTEDFLRAHWPSDVPVEFLAPENRWQFMRRCEMLIAASGTVTLESAIVGTPTIATYKVAPLTHAIGRMLIKAPYMSLANLIMEKEIFPELLRETWDGETLAAKALEWLLPKPGETPLERVRTELDEVRRRLGEPGAPTRAAEIILEDLRQI